MNISILCNQYVNCICVYLKIEKLSVKTDGKGKEKFDDQSVEFILQYLEHVNVVYIGLVEVCINWLKGTKATGTLFDIQDFCLNWLYNLSLDESPRDTMSKGY